MVLATLVWSYDEVITKIDLMKVSLRSILPFLLGFSAIFYTLRKMIEKINTIYIQFSIYKVAE